MGALKVNQLANATSVVATTNYPFTSDFHKVISVHVIWTSTTASATIKLQCSNDATNWSDFTTATSIANNSGDVFYAVDQVKDAFYWRVLITYTSGTITTLKAFLAYLQR